MHSSANFFLMKIKIPKAIMSKANFNMKILKIASMILLSFQVLMNPKSDTSIIDAPNAIKYTFFLNLL